MKFKQIQQRAIDFYIHYLGDMEESAATIRRFTKDMYKAKKLPELVGAFESVGFDTEAEVIEFLKEGDTKTINKALSLATSLARNLAESRQEQLAEVF